MEKHELMILSTEDTLLSLQELCEICHLSKAYLNEFLASGIIQPIGILNNQWQFDLKTLYRIKTALRLQHDLEINNVQALALILDLLDEVRELRERVKVLDKQFWNL